jgi:hypothetical protein
MQNQIYEQSKKERMMDKAEQVELRRQDKEEASKAQAALQKAITDQGTVMVGSLKVMSKALEKMDDTQKAMGHQTVQMIRYMAVKGDQEYDHRRLEAEQEDARENDAAAHQLVVTQYSLTQTAVANVITTNLIRRITAMFDEHGGIFCIEVFAAFQQNGADSIDPIMQEFRGLDDPVPGEPAIKKLTAILQKMAKLLQQWTTAGTFIKLSNDKLLANREARKSTLRQLTESQRAIGASGIMALTSGAPQPPTAVEQEKGDGMDTDRFTDICDDAASPPAPAPSPAPAPTSSIHTVPLPNPGGRDRPIVPISASWEQHGFEAERQLPGLQPTAKLFERGFQLQQGGGGGYYVDVPPGTVPYRIPFGVAMRTGPDQGEQISGAKCTTTELQGSGVAGDEGDADAQAVDASMHGAGDDAEGGVDAAIDVDMDCDAEDGLTMPVVPAVRRQSGMDDGDDASMGDGVDIEKVLQDMDEVHITQPPPTLSEQQTQPDDDEAQQAHDEAMAATQRMHARHLREAGAAMAVAAEHAYDAHRTAVGASNRAATYAADCLKDETAKKASAAATPAKPRAGTKLQSRAADASAGAAASTGAAATAAAGCSGSACTTRPFCQLEIDGPEEAKF